MNNMFSVAMSVYKNDNPEDFKEAVHSIYHNQSVKPSEIILVQDGPIPIELKEVIDELVAEIPVMKLVVFEHNRGHAAARQAGLEKASNNLVAIMDADDIAVTNRFELTLKAFEDNPNASVIGGNINEFIENLDNRVGCRIVPERDVEIKRYLRKRCPMNLVTVMYHKERIQEVGGFIDWYCEEDYYLWIRLALAGHEFYNIQENLVNVRVGTEMYSRRWGWSYFKSEATLQRYMWKHDVIGLGRYLYNVAMRFALQVAMPNRVRGWVFRKFARTKE